MKRFFSSFGVFELIIFTVLVMIFGMSFGVFTHGYWLIDLFPVDSRRLLYSTLLSCFLGMAGYLFLFRWLKDRLADFTRQQLIALVGSSVLIGTFLFFTTTDRWQRPARYATLFLPDHTLEISISATQAPGKVYLLWFNTALGDISSGDLDYEGWEWKNDQFVLTDFSNNQLRWVGKTGEKAQVVFRSSLENGDMLISWDGQKDVLPLIKKEYNFLRSFNIPFYASKAWILLLGALNFSIFSFPLCLLIWGRRSKILQSLNHVLSETPPRFNANEGVMLLLALVLASLLRVPNLENLFPAIDEYQHIFAAQQIIQGVAWQDLYQRSLWVVTLPVSLAFRVFGYEIWAARLMGVFFNVLAIIPLYLVSRKINRPVAILSVLLYATSPLMIALARVVREYAYYPFYCYWIIYGMIVFLERIRDRFRRPGGWRVLFAPSQILLGLGLLIPAFYALYIDTFSTFKMILIAYVALGIFIPLMMGLKNWSNIFVIVVMGGLMFVTAYSWLGRFSFSLGFNVSPINYFFPNPPQQWYFDRLVVIPAIGLLGGIVTSLFMRRANFAPFFFTALYAGFIVFFVFSSVSHFEARHLSMAHLWYIVLIAFGLQVVWIFLQTLAFFDKGLIKYSIVFVLGALSINSQHILLPLTSHGPYMPVSGLYHPELSQPHEFLLANAQKEDVLISTNVYSWYATWMDEPEFSAKYGVGIDAKTEDVFSIVARHDSGWIVLDKVWINQFAFSPLESFPKNDAIEYVGLFGDEYIWRWQTK